MHFLDKHDGVQMGSKCSRREGAAADFQPLLRLSFMGWWAREDALIVHLYLLPFSERARLPQHEAQVGPNRKVGESFHRRVRECFPTKWADGWRTKLATVKPLLMTQTHCWTTQSLLKLMFSNVKKKKLANYCQGLFHFTGRKVQHFILSFRKVVRPEPG